MLTKGQPFPDFELRDQAGAAISQKDLKGQWTVVYFYVKDFSDLCTVQAKEFTALGRKYKARGCQVWGVSADSARSHSIVHQRLRLFQSLLSDPDHALMTAAGVWAPKILHGKELVGLHRSAFIVDPDGIVQEALADKAPASHAVLALERLAAIQKERQAAS
jgi:peroxiredoxin Q/BCP